MKKLSTMLIALLAVVTMSANTFTKVTSAPDDWSGQYLVTYHTDSMDYVFNGVDAANGYQKALATNGVIESDELDELVVEIAPMAGGYSVKWFAKGTYMSGTSGSNTLNFTSNPVLNTIKFNKVDSIEFVSNTSILTFNTVAGNMRFRYYKSTTASGKAYKGLSLYKVESPVEPDTWDPDTISVSEVKRLIRDSVKGEDGKLLMKRTHYVKGIVSNPNFGNQWPGYAIVWLRDIENESDTIEAYKIFKDANSTKWTSKEDIPFDYCDTVLIFADELQHYKDAKTDVDEISSGHFAKLFGKSQMIDHTTVFPFAYGAVVGEADEVGKKYHFDVVLTSEEGNPNKGIHMGIVSSHEDGIAGSYTLYPDNSFVNGVTATDTSWISGSVKITYVEAGEVYNKYEIVANYSLNDQIYRLDSIYEIPAITEEEWYNLDDDKPFIPKEGDTITCEQALSYAKSLGTETSPMKVYIRGWVVSNPKTSDSNMSQRNFYINDDPKASKGIAQSYYCYEQGLDSIAKGNEVLLYGNILLYGDVAEIKNGQIYRLTGTEQHYRDIKCEEAPETFIRSEEAYEIGMMLDAAPGQTVESEEEYTVVGYIAKVSYQTKNDTATWFMADDMAATYGNLQAYKCYIPALIEHGDAVMVTGKIMKYVKEDGSKTTIELKAATATFLCSIPSGLPTISVKKGDVRKMIMDGRFYILHGHNWYNAQGEIVGHE